MLISDISEAAFALWERTSPDCFGASRDQGKAEAAPDSSRGRATMSLRRSGSLVEPGLLDTYLDCAGDTVSKGYPVLCGQDGMDGWGVPDGAQN